MSRHVGNRTGAASRAILVLLLVAGAIVAGLAFLLKSGGAPADTTRAEASAPAASAPAESELSRDEGKGRDALDGGGDATVRAGGLPVGTRLSGDGRLEGRVIDRVSGAGVAGARVELSPLPPAASTLAARILRLLGLGPELPERVLPVASTMSVDGGNFAFVGVRTGSWFVDARGPFHAPEGSARALVQKSGGGPLEVHVRAGGRVVGRVVTPDGKPASAAHVVLIGGPGRFLQDAASGDLRLFEATCEADGAFAFDGVPPGGGYDVSAAADTFAVTHLVGVDVVAGKETRADVQARAGATVTGRVVESRGTEPTIPLAGAHVAAIPRGIRDLLLVGEVLAATHAVTAADGSFTLARVPPGEIDVAVVAAEHLPTLGGRAIVADRARVSVDDITLAPGTMVRGRTVDAAGAPIAGVQLRWNPLEGTEFSPQDFSFAPLLGQAIPGWIFPTTDADGRFAAGPMAGDPPYSLNFHKLGWEDKSESVDAEKAATEITVVLARGGAVEGTVVDEKSGEPVTTFTVSAADSIDTEAGVPGAWNPFTGGKFVEDDHGRFRLDAVAAGTKMLRVTSRGYADEEVPVEVPEGGVAHDVVVKLHPGGKIRGVVVDEQANPVAGAHVVAVPDDKEGVTGRKRARASVSPLSGLGSVPAPLLGYAAGLGLLGDREVVSGARGEFALEGVAEGALHVRAFHRDQAYGVSEPLELEEGGTIENVRIEMHTGGGVEGKVSDRHGQPVEGDMVIALAPMAMGGMGGGAANGALYQGQSDAKGLYKISHMAAGSYFLVVTRGDEALHPMSFMSRLNFDMVTVVEGQTVHYDLVDSTNGGCHVHGTILDAGKPVASGTLIGLGSEGNGALGVDMKIAHVSLGGQYDYPGLAPGRWQLTLQGRREESGPGEVRMLLDVPDQPELRADLSLPEGGLEGQVIDDSTHEPVANADVRLRALGAPRLKGLLAMAMSQEGGARATSDESGHFSFDRLCAAEYEVTVRPPRGKENSKRWAPPDPVVVRVDEGRVERGCVLRLVAPVTLVGFVRGEGGEAIEGARVFVRRQDRPEGRPERTRSDASGRFEVAGLAPGVYVLGAAAKDYADGTQRDVHVERASGEAKPQEIRLSRGVAVTVRVYQNDGQPASGARATLYRADEGPSLDSSDANRVLEGMFKGEGASDPEGKIEMGRFLPGEYRLEVQRGGANVEIPRVTIRGDRAEVELRAELP
ncbi:MAG TPA: carboxypeptidase regulatory-like domain-containing protein [Planctomycetota bacterium]|jgi:hypothetical protein|nr:carboxypeptidase regulatory-like domain-containing protein [Planctomycetota bacterium]